MNNIKNFFISLALSVLMIISLLGIAVWGTVIAEKYNTGQKDYPLPSITSDSSSTKIEHIYSEVERLVKAEQYDILQVFAMETGISYTVSSKNGSPISHFYSSENPFSENEIGLSKSISIRQPSGDILLVKVLIRQNPEANNSLSFYRSIIKSNNWLLFGGAVLWLVIFIPCVIFLFILASPIFKVWLCLTLLTIVEIFVLNNSFDNARWLVTGCIFEKVVLGSILTFYIIYLGTLRKSIQKISDSGQDKSILNVKSYPISLKPFVTDINKASENISAAICEKVKSERMKAELISNVSHDIKTPLTSIINFSDLIYKEKTENEVITEYAEHLHAQSIRMKAMLEALIEAARASAGAIDITLEPCKVSTLLEQCVIEYEEKLMEKDIALVIEASDDDLYINTDVKAMSRIMDNLLTNISKYAMQGSRAYIKASKIEDEVVIAFKNITEEPINISEDELTERFVRGDVSRHSDGYGLGLSIVKSLMDLMDAKINISAQFDVFEVKLIFAETVPDISCK